MEKFLIYNQFMLIAFFHLIFYLFFHIKLNNNNNIKLVENSKINGIFLTFKKKIGYKLFVIHKYRFVKKLN
jgi:hypothetical protein